MDINMKRILYLKIINIKTRVECNFETKTRKPNMTNVYQTKQ